jgi:hypothetical protein
MNGGCRSQREEAAFYSLGVRGRRIAVGVRQQPNQLDSAFGPETPAGQFASSPEPAGARRPWQGLRHGAS